MSNNISVLIINASHSLLPQQEEILAAQIGEFDTFQVPEEGWNLKQISFYFNHIASVYERAIVLSPIPLLLGKLAAHAAFSEYAENNQRLFSCYVFHNDRREKKELPGGKIVMVVPKEGWELVKI